MIEGCCNALVDELVPVFVKTPSSEQEWLEISRFQDGTIHTV